MWQDQVDPVDRAAKEEIKQMGLEDFTGGL